MKYKTGDHEYNEALRHRDCFFFMTINRTMKKIAVLSATLIIALAMSSFQDKPKFDLKASIARGQEVYNAQCLSCHMEQGEGIEDIYPPVAKSDYLMADKKRSIRQILFGVTGEIKVNGKTYNGEMAGFDLSDEQVSDVLNYIRNSFGNKGAGITPAEVAEAKK
jgi:mono/diheme cytochrome c family protein